VVHESARKYQPPTWLAANLREPRDGFRTHAELRAGLCKRRTVAFFSEKLGEEYSERSEIVREV